ncbi:class I SAM-dependent DNA methyltransferase [Anaerosporobacter faecicola]|uniref:class I SAM-dependent DNA methyltransferase n=1 Tax=Anaerosporobacter faecicola TaxID=2718714 RepID=UPI00143AD330|nr:class I SAM-dependent methyltransferase [Anaerosporobacter faecicola]
MNEIQKNWDAMAKAYEEFTEGKESYSYRIEWPCIQRMLPELKGKNVLDLGCGTGRFSFLFEDKEPSVVDGIDLSEQMLTLAKTKSLVRKSKVHFIQGDITNVSDYVDKTYDLVFSSTTLHYIQNLQQFFKQLSLVMNEAGIGILSLMHPIYTSQYPIDQNGKFPRDEEWNVRYLDTSLRSYMQPWIEYNDSVEKFLSSSYHHTFSDYFNAIINTGFQILQVEEPKPPIEWKERYPERYDSFIETPSYLIIKIKKSSI